MVASDVRLGYAILEAVEIKEFAVPENEIAREGDHLVADLHEVAHRTARVPWGIEDSDVESPRAEGVATLDTPRDLKRLVEDLRALLGVVMEPFLPERRPVTLHAGEGSQFP